MTELAASCPLLLSETLKRSKSDRNRKVQSQDLCNMASPGGQSGAGQLLHGYPGWDWAVHTWHPAPVPFHFQEAAPELWGTLNSHCQENTISAKMKQWEEAAFFSFHIFFF